MCVGDLQERYAQAVANTEQAGIDKARPPRASATCSSPGL